MPALELLRRVKAASCKILSSATSVKEARWLYENGADVVIAQGAEAGGHRGMFIETDVDTQIGTFALVPQIVDAVPVPVIAAGGIADARGVAAAFALGAAAICVARKPTSRSCIARRSRGPSPQPSSPTCSQDAQPALSSITSSRSKIALGAPPAFPLATQASLPLRTKAETKGSGDFSSFWSGEARALGRDMNAEDLTKMIAEESLALLHSLAQVSGKR